MSMEVKPSSASQHSTTQQQKMSRTASKVSVSASQTSERARMNAAEQNKDPMNALSRMTPRQMAERRSGLQDVDEDYLKNVVYAYAGRTKVAAAQRNEVRADMVPAGVPTLRTPLNQSQRTQGGAESTEPMSATQSQQQQQSARTTTSSATERTMPTQPTAAAPSVPPQQNQASARQQQPCSPQGACGGDPEMYTTCPNCRATLYLVRNAGDPSPYGTEHTQQPASQQQKLNQPPPTAQQGAPSIPVPPC